MHVPVFPNGSHVCEVEIDTDTGVIELVRYTAIDDVGRAINPMIVDGQTHGGIVQGLGQAMCEAWVCDPVSGQPLSGSFMDYGMPRADMMPDIISELSLVPTGTNLLGVKGGSEAGNCGMPPAIIHAVLDALSPWGVTDIPIPATPERVWHAIHTA
mgnify:CR=1 FL=1